MPQIQFGARQFVLGTPAQIQNLNQTVNTYKGDIPVDTISLEGFGSLRSLRLLGETDELEAMYQDPKRREALQDVLDGLIPGFALEDVPNYTGEYILTGEDALAYQAIKPAFETVLSDLSQIFNDLINQLSIIQQRIDLSEADTALARELAFSNAGIQLRKKLLNTQNFKALFPDKSSFDELTPQLEVIRDSIRAHTHGEIPTEQFIPETQQRIETLINDILNKIDLPKPTRKVIDYLLKPYIEMAALFSATPGNQEVMVNFVQRYVDQLVTATDLHNTLTTDQRINDQPLGALAKRDPTLRIMPFLRLQLSPKQAIRTVSNTMQGLAKAVEPFKDVLPPYFLNGGADHN